ncbi:MAG: hypothetical protein U0U09_11265 [Cyclobacteriaceae bacterium]
MEQSQSSMYVSLKQLVWSAVIGVFSFQVIAPTVWAYVNSILGIPFYQGYIIFVLVYALTLLIITGIWLLYNRQPLQQCLTGNVTLCRTFLAGLTVSILIQVFAISFFLTRYRLSVEAFVTLQAIIFVLNAALLSVSIWITIGRIRKFSSGSTDKRVTAARDTAYRIIAGCVIAVIILCLFGKIHWQHNQQFYYTGDSTKIASGFRYLDNRKALEPLLAEAKYQAEYLRLADTEASIVVAQAGINRVAQNKPDTASVTHNTPAQQKSTQTSATTSNVTIKNSGPSANQSVVVYTETQQDSIRIASLSTRYKTLAGLLTRKKDITLRVGQKIVGQLLRDHQLKLIYLFINALIVLISLFLFFRTDYLIKEYQWKEADQASTLYPGTFDFKVATLRANETQRVSLRLVSDIWLYVTIAVWLMVPLFKPVEDEKINADAPFKALTFSGPGAPWEKWINSQNLAVNVNDNSSITTINPADIELVVQLQTNLDEINTLLADIAANTNTLVQENKKLVNNTQQIISRNETLIQKSDTLIKRSGIIIRQNQKFIHKTDSIANRVQ